MRENKYLINTIQEITLQSYAFGIYDYFFNERNMSRTDIFNIFVEWAKEFEETHENFDWMQGSFYDEVDDFLSCRFDSIRIADKIRDAFPGGITKGDHISYEGGIFKVTGFSERGILVEEVKPCPENPDWIILEIGFAKSDKVKIIQGYEDIIDTTNNHDPELVAKINIAWNEKREQFCPILRALYERDIKEIMESDAWNWTDEIESVKECLHDEWDFHAYNYLMHIADDWDLKAILYFLRYEA